ncbi:unnamed protein product, partial [Iphiclides podalirius]
MILQKRCVLVDYLEEKIEVIPRIEIKVDQEDGAVPVSRSIEEKAAEPEVYNLNKARYGDLKRILVKRKVPHGFLAPEYEYDYKYNTYYRPLFRIHKSRETNTLPENAGESSIYSDNKNKLAYIIMTSNDRKRKRIKPNLHDSSPIHTVSRNPKSHVKKSKQAFKDGKSYLDFLLEYLSSTVSAPTMLSRYINKSPRSPIFGEQSDFTNSVRTVPDPEATKEKKQTWLPKYPLWNFWTYKKSIYQDECPGLQINVGGLCIRVPPH